MKQEHESIFVTMRMLAALAMLVPSAHVIVRSAGAQTSTAPQFEVASLTVSSPAGLSRSPRRTGEQFSWTVPLEWLLSYAYDLPRWRISGAADRQFYHVEARTTLKAAEDDVRLMLRTLVIDRFRIASHRVTKEVQGYALVVAKGGTKLKTANNQGEAPPMPEFLQGPPEPFEGRILTSAPGVGVSGIVGRGVSISQLAEELEKSLGTFVVDRTGLSGKYYFGFTFAFETGPLENSSAPSVFSVLPRELGLRLNRERGPVEMLVVDHFEKAPVAN